MIPRIAEKTLRRYAKGFPVACITGPRQSGKTTLAKLTFPKKKYISLEDPDIALLARSDPRGFLETWPNGLILDEAQYVPELFAYIKTMVDKDPKPGKYIITGSQQFNLMEKVTESLAGRAAFLTLFPFSMAELEPLGMCGQDPFELILKGLYPPLYDRNISARDFYSAYIASYIERDLRQLVNVKDLSTFQHFTKFCAARTGGILNLSSLAADCGITHNTAKAWISALETSGIIFLLKPYYKNFGKRLIKSPKLYFTDSGLACRLLGIKTVRELFINPLRGSLFEGFIISELIKNRLNRGETPELWFWRDNAGTEIDCLIGDGEKLYATEIKSGKTFNEEMIRSLNHWQKINGTSAKTKMLVYAGSEKTTFKGIRLVPWRETMFL
ncbi:MAG: ATP-binding protein [Treponema sp.]|nr:ATP-binding protein [Treponema sp.]